MEAGEPSTCLPPWGTRNTCNRTAGVEWEPDSSSVCAHQVTWAGAGPSWAPFMSGGRGGGGQPSGEQQGRNASRWHSPQGHPAPHTQQRRGACWLSQVGGAWYRHLAGSCQGCCYAPARHRAAPTEKDWVLGSTVGIDHTVHTRHHHLYTCHHNPTHVTEIAPTSVVHQLHAQAVGG